MSRLFLSSIALLVVACTGGSGPDDPTNPSDPSDPSDPTNPSDPTGLSEGPSCEATETEVTLDEVTALGFAAQAIVDLADGEHLSTMVWQDDGSSGLTVTATLEGRVLFVDEEAVYPTGSGEAPAIGVVCEDYVAIEGTLRVATADGLLDETMDVTFRSMSGLVVDAGGALDPDDLTGSLVFDDFHEEVDYDARSMLLNARFDSEGTSGEVAGSVQGTGDCEDDEECTAWAAVFAFGAWGLEDGR